MPTLAHACGRPWVTEHSTPSSSVLCCCLHLPIAVPKACRPHFFPQIHYPDVSGCPLPLRPCGDDCHRFFSYNV